MAEVESKAPRAAPKRVRRPVKRKVKRVRWTIKREAAFLEALAQTSNVAASARAAGVGESTVYARRMQSEEFRAAWAAALREGYARLEAMVLARALDGVRKPIFHGGKEVGSTVEYDNRTALALLAAHGRTVHGSPQETAPLGVEALRQELRARTAEMNRRMGGAG